MSQLERVQRMRLGQLHSPNSKCTIRCLQNDPLVLDPPFNLDKVYRVSMSVPLWNRPPGRHGPSGFPFVPVNRKARQTP